MSQNLFPEIRAVAEETEQLADREGENVESTTEDDERPMQEIESLCMRCGEQGVTRLLLTSIPFFREVIVMSFRCESCGFQNNEVQQAGAIRPDGTVYTLRVLSREDLNRQLIKSSTGTIEIPEFELTIPASRGQLTTIEGVLRDTIQTIIDGLKEILADHEDEDEDSAIGEVKLPRKASEKDAPMRPFTVRLDDPSGNSFIEFNGSMADPKWNMRTYHRTKQHNIDLGLINPDEPDELLPKVNGEGDEGVENANEEIFIFPGTCSSCGHAINTLMKKVNIPYFKDVIIMSTNCDKCGYRDNEVKSGSAISLQGKRITLKVEDQEDLSRDILKSETCGLEIPEIELVLTRGTLELSEKVFSDTRRGDDKFEEFLAKLKAVKSADQPFTVILDDPLANSYLQNLYAPDPDPNMTIETYDRTWEQNEELGLNDMKLEGYEEDAAKESAEQEVPAEQS
ncbi:zf-ZPR1-domain-containing protein [Fomitopsis serialis]|uniref:zf-ZPR1-domain-containing protein n=1 Tax=Fomitopsis serialis TaxID=139415 RepID=UPI0020075477|nr:zf-ZPR1-domain-containing protein [Neoantrodia serialis]KAH9924712.1 zf-ZPR1-domain-containing protein [Neoantrodia serialis]